jgi:hypothetical protein
LNFGPYLKIDTRSVQHLVPPAKTERFEGIAFSSFGIMAIATSETNSVMPKDEKAIP